jgi:hypothetical protein
MHLTTCIRNVVVIVTAVIINSCTSNIARKSVIQPHGISCERFAVVEKKWNNRKLPFPLYDCMSPLSLEEIRSVLGDRCTKTEQAQFDIFNDPTKLSGIYELSLSTKTKLTDREFIEIAAGMRESDILIDEICHHYPFSNIGGSIVP